MINNITLRGRTPGDQKERDLDLFPAEPSEDQEWIGLSIRQPSKSKDEAFATIWVLKRDLLSALAAISESLPEQTGHIDWLIEQVRKRRLSYGKAAELAGIPKARFIQLMGERHVSSLDYDDADLADEIRAAEDQPQ